MTDLEGNQPTDALLIHTGAKDYVVAASRYEKEAPRCDAQVRFP